MQVLCPPHRPNVRVHTGTQHLDRFAHHELRFRMPTQRQVFGHDFTLHYLRHPEPLYTYVMTRMGANGELS